MYAGHTIFSIFYDKERVYTAIKDYVVGNDFEPQEQDGVEVENNFLRRLIRILVLPTVKLSKEENQ